MNKEEADKGNGHGQVPADRAPDGKPSRIGAGDARADGARADGARAGKTRPAKPGAAKPGTTRADRAGTDGIDGTGQAGRNRGAATDLRVGPGASATPRRAAPPLVATPPDAAPTAARPPAPPELTAQPGRASRARDAAGALSSGAHAPSSRSARPRAALSGAPPSLSPSPAVPQSMPHAGPDGAGRPSPAKPRSWSGRTPDKPLAPSPVPSQALPAGDTGAAAPQRQPPALGRLAGTDARALALWLLAGVREGWGLDDLLDLPALARSEPADRARARRLATAALRLRGRAEAVLTPLLPRRPRPAIADLLVLATVEMLGFDAPPHGVVSEAVSLARRQGPKGVAAAGMVNAVLRRAAEGRAVWDAAAPHRLPGWLRGPVATAWGASVADAIEAAHERGAPLDLTAHPAIAEVPGTRALPTGSFRLETGAQVSALPGFATGEWWVQDAAAALPVRLLDPELGERIADLCAAPGGKTLQLAAGGADVTAVDISAARLRRVAENLARCRLQAHLVTADALEWRPDGPLDAILLDAPCSATGTIRRHPELPAIRDGLGVEALVDLQARLLDHALGLLPPGGRLVFATCSLLTAEGEAQTAAALARHPGLTVERPDPVRLGIAPGWITPEGGIRLRPDYWPEMGGMDGFYMVRLRTSGGPA